MATATVESSVPDYHLNHLHSESIPSVDLHLFSQSELFSLSLCSSSSSLHHHQNDPDVSTLRIDRSVFNESAGSRKQTFSRIRLAPRSNSQFSPSSSIPHQTAEQTLDDDTPQIVAVLKSMFGGNSVEVSNAEDNLVSVPVQFNGFVNNGIVWFSDCNGDAEMKQMAVEDSTAKKRKRGKPRIFESNYNLNQDKRPALDEDAKVEKKEKSARINTSGRTVYLEKFGDMEDPYAWELNRRTLDMQTREQLLDFLQGLDGEWLSKRKKRKIVGATALGDFLPSGWKLILCMKNRAGYFWVDCRRYISPNGQQFMSCKEAFSYLNSSVGLQDASQLKFGSVNGNIQMSEKEPSGTAADLTFIDKNEGALVCCPGLPLSESVQHEKKFIEAGIPGMVGTVWKYKCHKCTMVFYEPDDLLQHFLSSHQKVPKKLGQETLNEEVIFNNGRYECQFCDKSYDERHRYYGHFGNHIKDYIKRIQASGEATRICRSIIPSVAVHPGAVKIQESTAIDMGPVATSSNTANESYCRKQNLICSMIGGEPGDSNDIVAVENNIFQEGSPKCSGAAAGMEEISAPDNTENQLGNMIKGHAHELGSDKNMVAQNSIEFGENIKDRNLFSAINSTEIQDREFVREYKASNVPGHDCLSREDVYVNGIEKINSEGCLLIPSGNEQKCVSVSDVHGISTSATMDMTYERVAQVCLSSTLNEKAVISDDKVNQLSATTMKESRYDDMGGSSNSALSVGSGYNNVTVEGFVTGKELESSTRSCLVIPTWIDQTSYAGNEMNATYRCIETKHGQEMKSEGGTLFGSEQCLGSENTVTKPSNGTREVHNHDEVLYVQSSTDNKGVDLVSLHETAVELESSSGNSLLVPTDNELTYSSKENEVLNGATKNLVQDKISDSDSLEDDKSFFKGDTHINFDYSNIEWDAGSIKGTIQEGYFNDCSLVTSGSPWNVSEANVIGEVKKKLQVVRRRKNEAGTGFSSTTQTSENVISNLTWKHDEESDMLRSFSDTSRVANSSGCFTACDLMSDKGGDEPFAEKFSGISGFEGLRSGNMGNIEYNFLSNHSDESKVFSDNAELAQGLGSSAWLEKEPLSLLPKIASRRHVCSAFCVWCKNEFHYEDFESETQISSMNFACSACEAKFSSNFNLL